MAVTLVPSQFFVPAAAREALAAVAELNGTDEVKSVGLPQYEATLIYSSGKEDDSLPEIFYVLEALQSCREYNKIVASFDGTILSLAIAQGKTLLLANEYRAADFTTAQYFIFLALKSLQLNPEISTVCFRSPLKMEEEMSLYRYFKSVEQI